MPNISERAMLCTLKLKIWQGERIDHATSAEVAHSKRADSDAARVVKRLISPSYTKPAREQANRIRYVWQARTLPWRNDGARVLSTDMFDDFMKAIGEPLEAFNRAADAFANNYPVIRAGAAQRLGQLYDEREFPSDGSVRSLFDVDLGFEPIAEDWRVKLDEHQMKYLRSKVQDQLNEGLEIAMRDLASRAEKVVSRLHERLTATADDGERRLLRTEVIDSITELAEAIPSMNITADPTIEKIAQDMKRRLTRFDAAQLRSDESLRKSVATDAAAVLSRINDYLGMAA